jgi:hypothetical protein
VLARRPVRGGAAALSAGIVPVAVVRAWVWCWRAGVSAGEDERDGDDHGGYQEAERGSGGYGGPQDSGGGAGDEVGAGLGGGEQPECGTAQRGGARVATAADSAVSPQPMPRPGRMNPAASSQG